jgi:spermidine synthase
VVQATSPLFARQSFWCIVTTVEQSGLAAAPYHVYVPSFGEWGFVLAGRTRPPAATMLPQGLRFLTAAILPQLFDFPADMARVDAERYYEHEWREINR